MHGIYNLANKVSGKKHKVALYMNNVFNVKYYNHLSRIKDIMPEPGRSLSLQYELDFWRQLDISGTSWARLIGKRVAHA